MKFENPELLYALILLVIPLIVHLFRLRKFEKHDFTNVKFLKKVIQETRKSSRLKKWLVLLTRILLFTCLILAFAKPYIPSETTAEESASTLFYLDNSFSNEGASGTNSHFQEAINELFEAAGNKQDFAVFTNDREYFDLNAADLQEGLQDIEFSSNQQDFSTISIRASEYFKNRPAASQTLILVSDLQQNMGSPENLFPDFQVAVIEPSSSLIKNIAIDSAYVVNSDPQNIELQVLLNSNYTSEEPVSVSIFDGEKLLGRNSVKFNDSLASISFRLRNEQLDNGKIVLADNGISYDNTLYFNISEAEKIKVAIIGDAEDTFLKKIYTAPEFEVNSFKPKQIDFEKLTNSNLVILNELLSFPPSLANNLQSLIENGSTIVFIPALEITNQSSMLNLLGFSGYDNLNQDEKLITQINYDHPIFNAVFEDRTQNFEYPKTQSNYDIPASNSILQYENGAAFLRKSAGSTYQFAAPVNKSNSNFQSSPLIVPIFYQFGLTSLKLPKIYYNLESENKVNLRVEANTEAVIHLANGKENIIPIQQNLGNNIELSTAEIDLPAGNYAAELNGKRVATLSFNYSRFESDLQYHRISDLKNVKTYDSVKQFLNDLNESREITSLWKWFVIFALIFLALEMLLLKFLK